MTNFKALETLTKLAESVAIYVPTTDGTSEAADIAKVNAACSLVSTELATLFGGYTITTGDGGYIADNGELVEERVYIVKANTSELQEWQVENVVNLAERLRKFMNQECISLEVNGTLHFV